MTKFVDIEVDKASADLVKKGLRKFKGDMRQAVIAAIHATGLRIETIAKMRLNGTLGSPRHWVTGRLASSVHTEMKGVNTFKPIKDSKMGDGRLGVNIGELEAAVGTNVEYADKIEFDYDSFLRYAGENQSNELVKRGQQEINKQIDRFNR
jgi:hypothetical protein